MAKRKKTPPELDKAMDIILAHKPKRNDEKKPKSGYTYQLKRNKK